MDRLFSLAEICQVTGGTLIAGSPEAVVMGVSTDSRQVQSGDLFVALPGERVDGHQFLGSAWNRGARAALISRPRGMEPGWSGVILVEDTVRALGQLAAYHRRRFTLPVVGITGSVGKTSTKDMTAGVLGQRLRVLKSEGNLNTDIGLPLTLFHLTGEHQVAVLEMAMRALGEINYLCRIASPRVGIITTVGETHLEVLGSLENIARAKGELVAALPPDGVAILNGDNPWTRGMAARFPGRSIFFGVGPDNDIRPERISVAGAGTAYRLSTPAGEVEVNLAFLGRHQVMNSLAAAAAGLAFGLGLGEIKAGLEDFQATAMRMEMLHGEGLTLLNDAYNASPTSTRAAIQTLGEVASHQRKLALLGGMLELGSYTETGHREVGEAAAAIGVDYLITVGELGRLIAQGASVGGLPEARIITARDNQEALTILMDLIKAGDFLLVKGSRGMRMEEIVEPLRERFHLRPVRRHAAAFSSTQGTAEGSLKIPQRR